MNTNRNMEKNWFKSISFHVFYLGQSSFRTLEPWKIYSAAENPGSVLEDVFILFIVSTPFAHASKVVNTLVQKTFAEIRLLPNYYNSIAF